MRIIGYIEHPTLKITVFKMDNRLSIKFETGQLEQTYKFRASEHIAQLSDIQKLIDERFITGVSAQFQAMLGISGDALARHLPVVDADEFPRIV